MPRFEELYNEVPLLPASFIPPKCKRLIPDNENWKFTSSIDFQKYQSASERVWYVNQWLTKQKCRSHMAFATGQQDVDCPDGLGLIQKLPINGLTQSAVRELSALFVKERGNTHSAAAARKTAGYKQSLELLFGARNVFLPEAIEYLFSQEYRALATFILIYVKAIIHLLGGNPGIASSCLFSIVKYAPKAGMKIHMDGVEATDQEFGPAMAIPMGPGPKIFDLFPTFAHDEHPVRMKSQPFQPIMMQGSSRIAYAHAVPFGQNKEHTSLVFRFKEFVTSPLPKTIKYNPVLGHAATAISCPEKKIDH